MNNRKNISLKGARQNNLKNINAEIPLKKITVVTGVSGSGKSSLAFDTLYAEGSCRYMESMSTYARQFLEQMPRPDVDSIHNLPPAIALEQRNSITSSRTTISDITELADHFRLLFAAISTQSCIVCKHPHVGVNTAENLVSTIEKLPKKTRFYILASLDNLEIQSETKEDSPFLGQNLYKRGFQRLLVNNEVVDLSSAEGQIFNPSQMEAFVIVDRLVISSSMEEERPRLLESIETAFLYGDGKLEIRSAGGESILRASQGYSCLSCGHMHIPPSPPLFSSNSPLGACSTCNGFGEILELDEKLIIPNPDETLDRGAVDPLHKPSYLHWEKEMLQAMGYASRSSYSDLTPEKKALLWDGDEKFAGIHSYFERLKQKRYKIHVRVFIRRYQTLRLCDSCTGSRLSPAPLRYSVQGKSIANIFDLTIKQCLQWAQDLSLPKHEQEKAKEIISQISARLSFLESLGISYLKLNRKANSLSGGEYQRICLASQLGSKLSNTLYVLDEPSIGLHPVDVGRLINAIKELRSHGNTLVVVEHDMEIMRAADFLIELGPQAGAQGGALISIGTKDRFLKNRKSISARYMSGELKIPQPKKRRKPSEKVLKMTKCSSNNLKNIDLVIPLGTLVAVTGVSGSGKSTLIHDTFYKALAKFVGKEPIPDNEMGKFNEIHGMENIQEVSLLNQKPIGRNIRSNPATYLKIYDEIRRVMAIQPQSARLHLTPTHFSFNVDSGRCENCKGEGFVEVDMHFMANMRLTCEECDGKRFKKHVLGVHYKGKNIDDILHTTISEAKIFFKDFPLIVQKLNTLDNVGLSYLQLGQSLSSLSGGECQRLKIASTIVNSSAKLTHQMLIFDEPTTGLHLHDIHHLIKLFHTLVDKKNTVVFIEHSLDMIAQADWIIDLGPKGGDEGGDIMAQGPPESVIRESKSVTGKFLAPFLNKKKS